MSKQQWLDNVRKHLDMANAGYVAAIVRAAQDPTDEHIREIDWYERRINDLGVLEMRVKARVPEDP
jgi:hypothetical protein